MPTAVNVSRRPSENDKVRFTKLHVLRLFGEILVALVAQLLLRQRLLRNLRVIEGPLNRAQHAAFNW